jgi:perosamine synthetase
MALAQATELLANRLQRSHIALTSSGSAALVVALKAADLAPGSEVVMPAICCPAVLFAIQLAGFRPVLADIDLDTLNPGVAEIERAVTPATSAIVAVHGFGRACEIEEIGAYAAGRGLFLIEDACLSLGGRAGSRPMGSFGDASIVSFGYDKPVARNYGGALATSDAALWDRVSALLAENRMLTYEQSDADVSSLVEGLTGLDEAVAERVANVELITSDLAASGVRQPRVEDATPYWRYPVLYAGERAKLLDSATKRDLLFTTHYRNLGELSTGVSCPSAEYASAHLLNFFVRPGTPKEDIRRKVEFLNEFAN